MIVLAEFSFSLGPQFFKTLMLLFLLALAIWVAAKFYRGWKEFGSEKPEVAFEQRGISPKVEEVRKGKTLIRKLTTAHTTLGGFPAVYYIRKVQRVENRPTHMSGCSLTIETPYSFPNTEVYHFGNSMWVSPFSVAEGGYMEAGRIAKPPRWPHSPKGLQAYSADPRFMEALARSGAFRWLESHPYWCWALRPDGRIEIMVYKTLAKWNSRTIPQSQELAEGIVGVLGQLTLPRRTPERDR